MKFLENILVTVDFSESSDYVIENAIKLAEKFNSHITLMHVIAEEHLPDKLDHFIEESVQSKLEKIASDIKAKGIKLKDSIIEHGTPFEKIINEAESNDYNVIIAGKSSKTENSAYGPGTTVDKLIRKNEVPIWVVKPEPVKPIQKILCPVDFSDASYRALDNALTLAQRFKASLTILHIYTPVSYSSIWYEADNEHENTILISKQEKEFQDFLSQFDLKGISYKEVIIIGEVHVEILNFIKENNIDLLLMGTTGRTGLSRILMGSSATKVTRESPCNFITTKTKNITDDSFENSLKSMESIMNSAKKHFEEEDYKKAIKKYKIALKRHPYNIPILMGIIKTYEAAKDKNKVEYYRNYAHHVIERIWGKEYLHKLKL
jgi:nucleotide-binding universal stress UspA family protein